MGNKIWGIIMASDPDIEFVRLCQDGDTSAFDEIVRRHKDRIYRLVYRMLGNESEVDDVAQEVFLKAYRHIKKFRFQSCFSTWLTQIAVNYCIGYMKKQRLKMLSLGRRSSDIPQPTTENNERLDKVRRAINSLPPKHKAVIVMHYFENYNCEEMADILKCSSGTVKSRLFYARSELKKRLKSYLKDEDWTEDSSQIGGENYEVF